MSNQLNIPFMLNPRERGYAVMSKELKDLGIIIEDESLEVCIGCCGKGEVVVERIPYVCGFTIKVMWFKYHKRISLSRGFWKNIFSIHWAAKKEYSHKTGAIVYENIPKE